MTKNTYITTPGHTSVINRLDPIVDELCEHTGFSRQELPDAQARREADKFLDDPAWSADSFNAGDWFREYLMYTKDEEVVLDIDKIMSTPVRYPYSERSHYHTFDYVPAHN